MTRVVHDHVSGTLSPLDEEIVRQVPPGGNWRNLPEDFPSARVRQIRLGASSGGGSRSTYYGRLEWDRPSYTISTYITRPGNGCFIHPELPRLVTIREAARLQSFPDYVRFHGTLRERCMQVGNAVPPLVAYRIGRTLQPGSVVDLFAGAGGVSLGLSWAGHDVIASVDNNRDACRTLAGALGSEHLVLERDLGSDEDVADMVTHVRRRLGGRQLGLLAGGPPCQGFSTAGPCRVNDPRNRLVLSFLRAVELLEPRQVLFENVVALRWRGKPFLAELTERLARLGYEVEVSVLHAEAYGVPQLRRRLVVRASSEAGTVSWPQPTHAMIMPCFQTDQPGVHLDSPRPHTVRDAIADLAVAAAPRLADATTAMPQISNYSQWAAGRISIDQLLPVVERATRNSTRQLALEGLDPPLLEASLRRRRTP